MVWKRFLAAIVCGVLVVPAAAAATVEGPADLVLEWVVRDGGPWDDRGSDLEVDGGQNVYVAATTESGGVGDLAVLKYDPDGELAWQHLLGLPMNRGLVEVDGAGDIYVAGTFDTEGPPTGRLIVLAKLSPDGEEVWRRVTFPILDDSFWLTGFEVDGDGNGYVLGYSGGSVSLIYAYDGDGNYRWETGMFGRMEDLELGVDGNLHVTGAIFHYSYPTSSWASTTATYDPNGSEIWEVEYDHEDEIDRGIAVVSDADGNVYVSGMSLVGDDVIKYGPDGAELWTAPYDGTGWQEALSIDVDGAGDVYVTGNTRLTETSLYHCLTVKYDGLTGATVWESRYETSGGEDLCADLELDASGHVYIGSSSVRDGNRDYAIVAYDPVAGEQIWEGRYDGPSNGPDWPAGFEIDSDGSVYVTGSSSTDHGDTDVATVKFGPNQPPVSDPGGPYLGAAGVGVTFDGSGSTDPEGGSLSYDWAWGDGTSPANAGATPSHTYAAAGIYDVCLTVTDPAGESDAACTSAVVFDPSGKFVTGSGWIDSPAGAYAPDPALAGKAAFGFVSKYKNGADTPTGNTEFVFKAADLDFHALTYDWLVVTGNDHARYRGIGTVNGTGDHKFLLWAGDNDPDTFRIRIWTEDPSGVETVVYDNGMNQPIGGGSIVVHAKGR